MPSMVLHRCQWVGDDPLLIHYHDHEWGVPVHDDRQLFEYLVLEGAQAGLSWRTVLCKREDYRQAFDDFEIAMVAQYSDATIQQLCQNPKIIRHRLKVESVINNAIQVQKIQAEFGTFNDCIWQFVGGTPKQNRWHSHAEIPSQTPESQAMSLALKKRGFKFVGATICYAFMQAVGMVNDHILDCDRYDVIYQMGKD